MGPCPAPWAHGDTAPLLGLSAACGTGDLCRGPASLSLEGPLYSPPVTSYRLASLPKQCHQLGPKGSKSSLTADGAVPVWEAGAQAWRFDLAGGSEVSHWAWFPALLPFSSP